MRLSPPLGVASLQWMHVSKYLLLTGCSVVKQSLNFILSILTHDLALHQMYFAKWRSMLSGNYSTHPTSKKLWLTCLFTIALWDHGVYFVCFAIRPSGWPRACYVARLASNFLFSPKCWDYSHHTWIFNFPFLFTLPKLTLWNLFSLILLVLSYL